MEPITDGSAVSSSGGEWAALSLVALAVLYLVARKFFKKKSGGSCCQTGCSAIKPASEPTKDRPDTPAKK